jgi:hypothetical protein
MNDSLLRLTLARDTQSYDSVMDRDVSRQEHDMSRTEDNVESARGTIRKILESAEYVSERATHLSTNVSEGIKATETLGAVARQLRTLSSNTSLEASRLNGSTTVAEIARQMRLLSQHVTALSEHLASCLRAQGIALGEMGAAIDSVLVDATSTQASLEQSTENLYSDRALLRGLLQAVPTMPITPEVATDGE